MGNDRRRRWIRPVILAMAAGLAAGFALPPRGWPWLLWPALAVLWSLAAGPPRPSAAVRLAPPFSWGLSAVLVSHLWLLWLHPLDWIGVPSALSLPICAGLWLLCGTLGGALVGLWAVVVGRLDPRRPSTALIGAIGWGLAEVGLAKGPLFWLGLGAAALPGDPPLAGLAALGGAGLLAATHLLVGWGLWRIAEDPRARRLRLVLLGALLLALQFSGAAVLGAAGGDEGSAETIVVLQPSIPTRRKFLSIEQRRLLERLRGGLREASDLGAVSLLLPEGALPLGQPLPETAPVEVLSGGFRWTGAEQRSSILRFAPGERFPRDWVDKHRVVPLGEWVPLSGLLRWSGLSAVGGLEPGPPSRLLGRPSVPVGVAICYEISDGAALAAATRQGAGWLLASANLDPYPAQLQGQFTALARLRAIESGRWLVSAANTGPSLLVDAGGRVRSELPAGIPATGAMAVHRRSRLTPYVRWGELPLLVLLVGAWGCRRLERTCGKVEVS